MPDAIGMAKGSAAGFPSGGVIRENAAEYFQPGRMAHLWRTPLACAARWRCST